MVWTVLKVLAGLLAFAVVAVLILRIAFALPANSGKPSTALPVVTDSDLARSIAKQAENHEGKSGVAGLQDGAGAFAARMVLARQATTSIDAQYYIWDSDLTGILLLDELRKAAERGVRVRLLVDDNGTSGLDRHFAELAANANMEIRLFNPFVFRRSKIANYAFAFFRLNHRMHNKSFTVDNLATIVGGRNIGDQYFGTGENALFIDMDILAVGEIVEDVSRDFDRYWNSKSAYPSETLIETRAPADPAQTALAVDVTRLSQSGQAADYKKIALSSREVAQLRDGSLDLQWVDVDLVSDDPAKAMGDLPFEDLLVSKLARVLGSPKQRLDMISPYFVPGKQGAENFITAARSGAEVRILTNSLAATDVAAVHAGYVRWRKKLLKGGVELYELKPSVAPEADGERLNITGSSSSSLHAKVFAIDGQTLYVGSFNFDPRSMYLNTEMGFVIESPVMAERVHKGFAGDLPDISYKAELKDGSLVWRERTADGEVVHEEEPDSSLGKRMTAWIVSWLPVEWLL